MRAVLALLLSLLIAPAWAQVPMTGAGKGTPGIAYIGPLDVYTTSPLGAYSCARAMSGAKAAAQANLCELVDSSAPTTPICTLKAKTDGFVDLATASCTGSLTPSAACAAATGGVCYVWKAYDQSGNSRDMVQATNANQPTIAFSSPGSGSLATIDCYANGAGGTRSLQYSSLTAAQPITFSAVAIHTLGSGLANIFGSSASSILLGITSTSVFVNGGTTLSTAASDATWYAIQGLANGNGTSSAININGSDTTGAAGTTGFSANTLSLCRVNFTSFNGKVAEYILWNGASTSTDRGNIAGNQRSATYGYGAF